MELAEKVRYRIIRRAPEIVLATLQQTTIFETLGMDSREAMASAALTVGWHFFGLDRKDVFAQAETEDIPDAVKTLNEILGLEHRLESGKTSTVLELLLGGSAEQVDDLFGVKITEVDGERVLAIAPDHPGLRRGLGRNYSQRSQLDHRQMLLQVPGATASPHALKFRYRRTRAVVFTAAVLAKAGIMLLNPHEQQQGAQQHDAEQRRF